MTLTFIIPKQAELPSFGNSAQSRDRVFPCAKFKGAVSTVPVSSHQCATAAEALKIRPGCPNKVTTRLAIKDLSSATCQVSHNSELISLNAIRTPHRFHLHIFT